MLAGICAAVNVNSR